MCIHGLVRAYCAICNGAVMVREPFTGRQRPENEPRLRKGRDSAQWIGVGRNLEPPEHVKTPTLADLTGSYTTQTAIRQTDKTCTEPVDVIVPLGAHKYGHAVEIQPVTRDVPVKVSVRLEPVRVGELKSMPVSLGLSKGSCIRAAGSTDWGREQMARSMADALRKLR